jgi:hypothetical protein
MVGLLKSFLLLVHQRKDPSFSWVGQDVGESVGPPIKFDHGEGRDDMRREAHARMNTLVIHGLHANAIRYLNSESMGARTSITTIQPCWV